MTVILCYKESSLALGEGLRVISYFQAVMQSSGGLFMSFNRQILTFVVAISIFWLAVDAHATYDSMGITAFKDLQVIKITPDGEDVPAGKQIVIQFDRPVVPIGKMERPSSEIPVIITPAIACEWRWLNTSALACNLPAKAPLKEATHYTLEIEPGIKAEDGATIPDSFHHDFITQRPDVSYHEFREWKSPGHPVIRLVFTQPVDKESVAQHVFWNVGDKAKRVAVNVKAPTRQIMNSLNLCPFREKMPYCCLTNSPHKKAMMIFIKAQERKRVESG